jgi:hypothetical protein
MTTAPLRAWSVTARNLPEHADNPIHTDEGARAAGFDAAIVAGVTVHAYLTRPVVEAWGTVWLAGGSSTVEFLAPVLADDLVDCVPVPATDGSVEVQALVGGDLRARLVVWREAPVVDDGGRRAGAPLPAHVEPLADGRADYAQRAGDDLSLYVDEGIVHPCAWPSLANGVMIRHLVDGPWIHTGSRIVHHATAVVGSDALIEATVVDRFETRRGTRAVVDVRISVDGSPVATLEHEALVFLRQTEV